MRRVYAGGANAGGIDLHTGFDNFQGHCFAREVIAGDRARSRGRIVPAMSTWKLIVRGNKFNHLEFNLFVAGMRAIGGMRIGHFLARRRIRRPVIAGDFPLGPVQVVVNHFAGLFALGVQFGLELDVMVAADRVFVGPCRDGVIGADLNGLIGE